MGNLALEVAAAAFGKIEQDEKNLVKKAGIGQNGYFTQRGVCCTIRQCPTLLCDCKPKKLPWGEKALGLLCV